MSKDGVVIRQFRNNDAEVLFADGVRAQFSKKRMEWTLTNNLGKRRRFRNGIYTDMEEVPTAVETDQETGAKMMIREDGVLSVTYADGSVYCHHQDGTKIHTTADRSEIRIANYQDRQGSPPDRSQIWTPPKRFLEGSWWHSPRNLFARWINDPNFPWFRIVK